VLVAEQQEVVLVVQLLELGRDLGIERLARVAPDDFGAQRRGQPSYVEAGHGHPLVARTVRRQSGR
jgi:hypothetical protein